jgi:hypothetical protein
VSSFGVGLTSDFTQNFALLNGDANRSGTVDITDFNVLASNFGKSGMTFSQGNFDFSADGKVTLQDFSVLASNFGKSLAPLSTAPDVQPSAMQTAIAQPAHSSKLPAVAKNKPDLLEDASLK